MLFSQCHKRILHSIRNFLQWKLFQILLVLNVGKAELLVFEKAWDNEFALILKAALQYFEEKLFDEIVLVTLFGHVLSIILRVQYFQVSLNKGQPFLFHSLCFFVEYIFFISQINSKHFLIKLFDKEFQDSLEYGNNVFFLL